jgi:hypothetical protein
MQRCGDRPNALTLWLERLLQMMCANGVMASSLFVAMIPRIGPNGKALELRSDPPVVTTSGRHARIGLRVADVIEAEAQGRRRASAGDGAAHGATVFPPQFRAHVADSEAEPSERGWLKSMSSISSISPVRLPDVASIEAVLQQGMGENTLRAPALEFGYLEACVRSEIREIAFQDGLIHYIRQADRERDGIIMMEDRSLKLLRKKARKGMRGWPLATIAFYGPNLIQATKVAVGIVPFENAEIAEMRDWKVDHGDIRADAGVAREILEFMDRHAVLSVAMTDGIIGCPHQEGIDYNGEWCPVCEFWRGRDRFTGQRVH